MTTDNIFKIHNHRKNRPTDVSDLEAKLTDLKTQKMGIETGAAALAIINKHLQDDYAELDAKVEALIEHLSKAAPTPESDKKALAKMTTRYRKLMDAYIKRTHQT